MVEWFPTQSMIASFQSEHAWKSERLALDVTGSSGIVECFAQSMIASFQSEHLAAT